MGIWDKNTEYLIDYWEHSTIGWQQENRDIINRAIRVYNDYVMEFTSLRTVQREILHAEMMLRNQPGIYMVDINLMKENVEKLENERWSNGKESYNTHK